MLSGGVPISIPNYDNKFEPNASLSIHKLGVCMCMCVSEKLFMYGFVHTGLTISVRL